MKINNINRHVGFVESWCELKSIRSKLLSLGFRAVKYVERPAPPESFNLLLVLVYSLLDDILNEYAAQGEFPLNSKESASLANGYYLGLEKKMRKSKNILTWVDFDAVDLSREKRNELAHRVKLSSRADCLKCMELIEQELLSWGVLDPWTWWEKREKQIINNTPRGVGPFYRAHKEYGHLTLEKTEDTPNSGSSDSNDFASFYWRPLHGYKVENKYIGFPPAKQREERAN